MSVGQGVTGHGVVSVGQSRGDRTCIRYRIVDIGQSRGDRSYAIGL